MTALRDELSPERLEAIRIELRELSQASDQLVCAEADAWSLLLDPTGEHGAFDQEVQNMYRASERIMARCTEIQEKL